MTNKREREGRLCTFHSRYVFAIPAMSGPFEKDL
jgi:hypothetical protein